MLTYTWSDGPACLSSSVISIACDSSGLVTVVVADCVSVGSACC